MNTYIPGLILVALGLITAVGGAQYDIGSAARMGPGYYPILLGIILAILGAMDLGAEMLKRRLQSSGSSKKFELRNVIAKYGRPWLAILAGAILFIVVGEYGGLVPATFLMIFVTALGDSETTIPQAAVLAVGVLAFTLLAFHYGMGLQFPLFRWG